MDPLRARGLNNHVMTQVRAHLPEWPHPDGRFLTELMIATGLRLGDACALGYDPLVYDNDANPYIRYWNHKMRRCRVGRAGWGSDWTRWSRCPAG
jgi:integrase